MAGVKAGEVLEQLDKAKSILEDALQQAGAISDHSDVKYGNFNGLDKVETDWNDPNSIFQRNQLEAILQDVSTVLYKLEYLQKPIIAEGTLQKNERGYYSAGMKEYHAGSRIEYLTLDPRYEDDSGQPAEAWKLSRIEFSWKEQRYYIVGAENTTLDGLKVRIR